MIKSTQVSSAQERRIANNIVRDAIEKGWTVSVYDGEDWTVKSSRDGVEITAAMGTTDSDALRFRLPQSTKVIGTVWLIWGNGEDLISDHSDNDEMNAFMAKRY